MTSRAERDAQLEPLVAAAAAGDEFAWHELWSHLEPRLTGLLRRPSFTGPLARAEDDVRDIVVAVMARLRQHGCQRLRVYLEQRRGDPELTFMRWLTVVAKRVAIDAQRAHPDYVDRRRAVPEGEDVSPGIWLESEELPEDGALGSSRPPMTNRVTARQILRYADGVCSGHQRRALEMWAEQASREDIARDLGLEDPDAAERLVRSAVDRLRRHFRGEPAP